jgi:hypothetical protein
MVRFDSVMERRDLADFDQRPVLLVVVLDGRCIGRTPVDRDLLGHAVAANRLLQKSSGSFLIPRRGPENGTRLAVCSHGASQRSPLPCHADVGLVHALAAPYRRQGKFATEPQVVFLTNLSPLEGQLTTLSSNPRLFARLLQGVSWPANLHATQENYWVYTRSGLEANGTYHLVIAWTKPNNLEDGRIDEGDILALDWKAVQFTGPASNLAAKARD